MSFFTCLFDRSCRSSSCKWPRLNFFDNGTTDCRVDVLVLCRPGWAVLRYSRARSSTRVKEWKVRHGEREREISSNLWYCLVVADSSRSDWLSLSRVDLDDHEEEFSYDNQRDPWQSRCTLYIEKEIVDRCQDKLDILQGCEEFHPDIIL